MDVKFLVVDLETIPAQSLPEECIPKFDENTVNVGYLKDPWKIKEKIQEARTKFEANIDKIMSVSPDLCQVCCLGYGDATDQQAVSAMDDASEYDLVVEAWSLISSAYHEKIPIVTFNGASFDIPVLLRRAMILDISVAPGMIAHLLARFDNRHHYDLMQMLGFRNPFSGKLEAHGLNYYLKRFGLGAKTDGMDGSMVYPAWKENRHSDIMDYCKQDVGMTAALFERISPWMIHPAKKEN
jgi:predicted PolB exonuclease-like 3'-5' exonuclease